MIINLYFHDTFALETETEIKTLRHFLPRRDVGTSGDGDVEIETTTMVMMA